MRIEKFHDFSNVFDNQISLISWLILLIKIQIDKYDEVKSLWSVSVTSKRVSSNDLPAVRISMSRVSLMHRSVSFWTPYDQLKEIHFIINPEALWNEAFNIKSDQSKNDVSFLGNWTDETWIFISNSLTNFRDLKRCAKKLGLKSMRSKM